MVIVNCHVFILEGSLQVSLCCPNFERTLGLKQHPPSTYIYIYTKDQHQAEVCRLIKQIDINSSISTKHPSIHPSIYQCPPSRIHPHRITPSNCTLQISQSMCLCIYIYRIHIYIQNTYIYIHIHIYIEYIYIQKTCIYIYIWLVINTFQLSPAVPCVYQII